MHVGSKTLYNPVTLQAQNLLVVTTMLTDSSRGIVSERIGLIPRQRNTSRETVYEKYGWLGMNDSIEFSHFFRLRSQ